MTLAIKGLAVRTAPVGRHASLLGTALTSAYHHLYDEAGMFSRPPGVRRGVTRMFSPEYEAPIAAAKDERSTDLASRAVAGLMHGLEGGACSVDSILHTQCTLDRQILGSSCLRIQHDHFPTAGSALTIGQLGTAALPTMLRLAGSKLRANPAEWISLSASDLWIAPFYRRIPDVVTYGDGAAACLLSVAQKAVRPVASVLCTTTGYRRFPADLWGAPSAVLAAELKAAAVDCIERALAQEPWIERRQLMVAGDVYAGDVAAQVAAAVGIENLPVPTPADAHLSSSSLLASIAAIVEATALSGRDRYGVVWTASLCGHAGAVLIKAHADAVRTECGWRSKTSTESPSHGASHEYPSPSRAWRGPVLPRPFRPAHP